MDATSQTPCKNCGTSSSSRFCPECGQSTVIPAATVPALVHEGFSAVFSYDSRLLRTIRVLVTQPGELTVAYLNGVRVRYISPFQLFVWLEAATFLVNRLAFDTDQKTSDLKSRDLFLVGVAVALFLSLIHARKRRNVIDSIVNTTHLWSFLMLTLLIEYGALPIVAKLVNIAAPQSQFHVGLVATIIAILAMVVYTPNPDYSSRFKIAAVCVFKV